MESNDWRPGQIGDQDSWIRHVLRREAEKMIIPKLPAFLDGNYEPHDYRTWAALAAACAGSGRGVDAVALDEAERAKWREMARHWLRADLSSFDNLVRKTKTARDRVIKTMTGWERELDLASIRELAQIAKLPTAELQGWLELWRDVSSAIDRFAQIQ